VTFLIGQREIGTCLKFFQRKSCGVHTERRENACAKGVFPFLVVEKAGDVARSHEHQVVVLKGRAKRLVGFEILQAANQIVTRKIGAIPDHVVARKAGTMRDQIANGHLFGEDGIVKFKCGKDGADGEIPAAFAFVHEHAEVGDGKGFCDAGDGAQRFRRHGKLFFHVAIAVAFEENYFVALNDGHGGTGAVPVFDGLVNEIVEAVEGFGGIDGFLLGESRRGEPQRRNKKVDDYTLKVHKMLRETLF